MLQLYNGERADDPIKRFQSLTGFSLCCNLLLSLPRDRLQKLSIPYWVFSMLQLYRIRDRDPDLDLSIPYWVFSMLQPTCTTQPPHTSRSFNPLLGFLYVATPRLPLCGFGQISFNPLLGFLYVATSRSRSRRAALSLSIPYWVFSMLQLCTVFRT